MAMKLQTGFTSLHPAVKVDVAQSIGLQETPSVAVFPTGAL